MKKASLNVYFALMVFQTISANFAHPVTPTLIQNLELNDYMFGVSFAAMALANFSVSPLFGKISDSVGRIKILGICCMGYAFGQFLFGSMTTESGIILARLVSGFFIGGISVTQLTYIIDLSDEKTKGRNLIIGASLQSVFGPVGFLVGGLIGTYSISLLFALQVIFLTTSGILILTFLKDVEKERAKLKPVELLKKANPIKPFLEAKYFITPLFALFFLRLMIASFGATAYDQCFNYYIKDFYGFTPNYNGVLKAAIGMIALITNLTISMYLTKKTNISKSIIYVFALASTMTFLVSVNKEFAIFVVLNLVYYGLNAIFVPMQQNLISRRSTENNSGQVMGFYNSINALGMVGGSLFAGFIYSSGASLSFTFASLCFIACFIISVYLYKKTNRGSKDEKSITA